MSSKWLSSIGFLFVEEVRLPIIVNTRFIWTLIDSCLIVNNLVQGKLVRDLEFWVGQAFN